MAMLLLLVCLSLVGLDECLALLASRLEMSCLLRLEYTH